MNPLTPIESNIQNKIFTLRSVQVMLDRDLAELYAVETKVLNQAMKRNSERFPERYCFQLSDEEWGSLRSQIVTLNEAKPNQRGQHRKYAPYVYSEQGVSMLHFRIVDRF